MQTPTLAFGSKAIWNIFLGENPETIKSALPERRRSMAHNQKTPEATHISLWSLFQKHICKLNTVTKCLHSDFPRSLLRALSFKRTQTEMHVYSCHASFVDS